MKWENQEEACKRYSDVGSDDAVALHLTLGSLQASRGRKIQCTSGIEATNAMPINETTTLPPFLKGCLSVDTSSVRNSAASNTSLI